MWYAAWIGSGENQPHLNPRSLRNLTQQNVTIPKLVDSFPLCIMHHCIQKKCNQRPALKFLLHVKPGTNKIHSVSPAVVSLLFQCFAQQNVFETQSSEFLLNVYYLNVTKPCMTYLLIENKIHRVRRLAFRTSCFWNHRCLFSAITVIASVKK